MNENETTLQRFSKLFNVHYPSKLLVINANRVAKEYNVTLFIYKTKDGQWYVNDSSAIKDSDTLMFIINPER